MSNERGVTLIETLVALVLFSMSAAIIGQFMVQHLRLMSSNQSHTVAYALAEEQLENLRSTEYDLIDSGSHEEAVGNQTYSVATVVTEGSPGPNMKKIAVNVGWDGPGGSQNVTVRTVYTEIKR